MKITPVQQKRNLDENDSGLSDVATGAFDGAEACKLAGNFLLHMLSEKYERKNLALYRDDGLAIFKNVNGPVSEKIQKNFCNLFIDHDPELTIQCNRKVVNFLDVTLNLENPTYRPYLKDNKIIYVNTESDHPPSTFKQLPKSIELRLSQLLANEEIFKKSVTPNETKALTKAGYNRNMRYKQIIR